MHLRSLLTETVDTTDTLFHNHWVPRKVIVYQMRTELHIKTFRTNFSGKKYAEITTCLELLNYLLSLFNVAMNGKDLVAHFPESDSKVSYGELKDGENYYFRCSGSLDSIENLDKVIYFGIREIILRRHIVTEGFNITVIIGKQPIAIDAARHHTLLLDKSQYRTFRYYFFAINVVFNTAFTFKIVVNYFIVNLSFSFRKTNVYLVGFTFRLLSFVSRYLTLTSS